MLGKKLSQNIIFNVLSMALSFLSSVFIARLGGAVIFGNIGLATSFQMLLRTLFFSSANNAHFKIFNDDPSINLKNFLFINLFFNLLSTILILTFFFYNVSITNSSFSDLQLKLILIFILQDFLLTPLFLYTTDQYARLKITKASIADLLSQVLISIAKVIAVMLFNSEIAIAWATIFACMISSIYPFYRILKMNVGSYTVLNLKKYLRYCLYLSYSSLALGLLSSFDKILFGLFSINPEEIGYYNAGNKIGMLFLSIGVSVGGIFLTIFTKNVKERNMTKTLEQLKNYERTITIFFMPVVIGVFIFGKPVLSLVYGHDFIKAYPVLILTFLMAYFKTLTIPYQNYLFANDNFKAFKRNSIIQSLLIVCFTFFFAIINPFSNIGTSVAFGLLLTSIIERIIYIRECRRIDENILYFFLPKILIFFCILLVIAFISSSYSVTNTLLSYLFGIMVMVSIVPVGFFCGIYFQNDFEKIFALVHGEKKSISIK